MDRTCDSVVSWGKLVLLLLVIRSASADVGHMGVAHVSSGYSQCSWKDNGDGTVTVGVTINYDYMPNINGSGGPMVFQARGVMFYSYDKTGTPKQNTFVADSVWLNGVGSTNRESTLPEYAIYTNRQFPPTSLPKTPWVEWRPFAATVTARIQKAKIAEWPAVSIRAADVTNEFDIAEITGGAYVSADTTGGCTLIADPIVTPPPPRPQIELTVTAPDWNLGELPRGNNEKVFTAPAEQLCFRTTNVLGDINIKNARFVIDAHNENGKAGNRYLLKNLADTTQTVPYGITLTRADMVAPPTMLPNDSSTSVPLGDGPSNCFIPTFSTSVSDDVKAGSYSDVLTFTVITKS